MSSQIWKRLIFRTFTILRPTPDEGAYSLSLPFDENLSSGLAPG